MRHIRVRFLLVAALTAAALLVAASSSLAAMSITSVDVSTSTTQAGGHPTLSVTTNFDGTNDQIGGPGLNPVADSPSFYTVHLGPGLFANPLAAPTCTLATFKADACPPQSIVGTSLQTVFALIPRIEARLPGFIYNVETTSPNQGAILGVRTLTRDSRGNIVTASLVPFVVTIDPDDLGLDSTNTERLTAVSPTAGPIRISALGLTLNARAAAGFFTSNPTACTPLDISVSATSNDGQTATGQSSPAFTPTDCGTLPFDVGLDTQLSTTQTDANVQAGVSLTMPGSDDPRRQSAVLDSTVVLPAGMTVNPSVATGLEACSDAQFAAGDRTTAATCPAASQIGTVSFVSPLFAQTFTGPVYYGTRTPTAFNRLFVDVPIPGVHLKLTGRVNLDASNGQVTTTFQDLPQLPFTNFNLTFQGGAHSVLSTPRACGPFTATANNTPFARLTDSTPLNATPTSTFTTSYDGAGAPCQNVFQPYFNGVLSNDKAGKSTNYALTFARPDRNTPISKATFRLPAGLIGDLALRGLTQCSLADAANAACADSSNVGTANVEVGVGPAPATVPGTVFLTQPQVAGDPAGLSVLVPAKIGPVDLGNVIVGVRLQLRANGGLDATSATLPQFQDGVPIAIRLATISITRDGFMRNPTSCGSKRYTGVFDALGGGSATTHARLSIADCRRLGFRPQISASIGARGKTTRGTHPPLTTVITQPAGQSAISRAHVLLPRAVSTNTTALNAACPPETFAAGRCSNKAKIGTARAISPLVTAPLSGPVYLVKQPRGLPKLVAQLTGPLSIDVTGYIKIGSRNNKIATTFPDVPDVTVTRFTLSFHSGKYGIVAAVANLCAKRRVIPSDFTAQNGKKVSLRPSIAVRGCPS